MGALVSLLLFQPPETTYLSKDKYFWLTTKYGCKIPSIFIKQKQAKFTILYSHGNAEDLGMIYDMLNHLSKILKVNVFAYDYSGYGMGVDRSDNLVKNIVPSEDNCYADIEAALEYLITKEMLCPSKIILYGRSLGSGPSCYLAQLLSKDAGYPLAGMILHSAFMSVYRIKMDIGVEVPYDIFPNSSRIEDAGCPTLIIHGTNDEIVPFHHGKVLYDALLENNKYKPFWVEGAGHNDIVRNMTSSYFERLQQFILHLEFLQNELERNESSRIIDQMSLISDISILSLHTVDDQCNFSFNQGKLIDASPGRCSSDGGTSPSTDRSEDHEMDVPPFEWCCS
mmetsp:Transcript_33306/g.38787  ORF Transcript_33306/g.38787 Transcript_33306/m.38787 type:complete len:339 (+) Transcript_33306:128-1144(+)